MRDFSEPVFFVDLIGVIRLSGLPKWRFGSWVGALLAVIKSQGLWVYDLHIVFNGLFVYRSQYLGTPLRKRPVLKIASVTLIEVLPFGVFIAYL